MTVESVKKDLSFEEKSEETFSTSPQIPWSNKQKQLHPFEKSLQRTTSHQGGMLCPVAVSFRVLGASLEGRFVGQILQFFNGP